MKKITLISFALGVFAAALSIISALMFPMNTAPRTPDEPPETEVRSPPTPTPTPGNNSPLPLPPPGNADARATVRVRDGDELLEMSMFQYLVGAVAGEMPASFEPDALRAQAAAARTFVLYGVFVEAPTRHPEAYVCTDPGCCAAFASEDALRERWGEDFDTNLSKIRSAVADTDGIYITYNSEPILAAFHSSSYGSTENAGDVWLGAPPYLVSVPSPETEEDAPGLISTVTVSLKDFKATAREALPDAVFNPDAESWITDIARDDAGRVKSLKIGGAAIAGTRLRALFGLRSTAVNIEVNHSDTGEGDIVFTTAGYGHGVGMSQYGANVMAKNGSDWRDILKAYYKGAELSDEIFVKTANL